MLSRQPYSVQSYNQNITWTPFELFIQLTTLIEEYKFNPSVPYEWERSMNLKYVIHLLSFYRSLIWLLSTPFSMLFWTVCYQSLPLCDVCCTVRRISFPSKIYEEQKDECRFICHKVKKKYLGRQVEAFWVNVCMSAEPTRVINASFSFSFRFRHFYRVYISSLSTVDSELTHTITLIMFMLCKIILCI